MKRILLATAILALSSTVHAEFKKCDDLSQHEFVAVYGEKQPLSEVIFQSLNNRDWQLNYTQVSNEPTVEGSIRGDIKSVIIGLVSKSIDAGWKINLSYSREQCKIKITILNKLNGSLRDLPKARLSKGIYQATKGMTLQKTLTEWATYNGGSVVWEYDKSIRLGGDIELKGSLSSAVSGLVKALGEVGKTINIRVYKNGFIRVTGVK